MSKVLNVGIIGCGEAAQILHIPTLLELRDRFRIAALCDASRKVVEGVGQSIPGASLHTDAGELFKLPEIDVVLIANPDVFHAPLAIAALEAGKHVLVEKPMCMTLSEADALTKAQERAGKVVQIGYMRRYAPAFEEAVGLVSEMRGSINYARVRGMAGPNSLIVGATTPVIRGDDISDVDLAAAKAATNARLVEAIGTDQNPHGIAYRSLLGFSSHDLSAMRELLGMPKSVLHASMRRGGGAMTAVFDYGDFVCQYEVCGFELARFDAHLEIFGQHRIVKVEYDTPYIRHQPARLTVTEAKGEYGVSEAHSHPTRTDAFVVEWQRFHRSVVDGDPVKTNVADARLDLELFAQIMDHF